MFSLERELVFLILQFLDEEKYKDTLHTLEKESGFFFNMRYFEDSVVNGELDEVDKYLLGFTTVEDNEFSRKIFFEIRKQKYLEALDKNDKSKALEILTKDLKVFSTFKKEVFQGLAGLLMLSNFREYEHLSNYGDPKSARATMLLEVKKIIEANPVFRDKLHFRAPKNSGLRTLIQQRKPKPDPDINPLFTDHTCGQPTGAQASSPIGNKYMPAMGGFSPLGPHGISQAPPGTSFAGWRGNPACVSSCLCFALCYLDIPQLKNCNKLWEKEMKWAHTRATSEQCLLPRIVKPEPKNSSY